MSLYEVCMMTLLSEEMPPFKEQTALGDAVSSVNQAAQGPLTDGAPLST